MSSLAALQAENARLEAIQREDPLSYDKLAQRAARKRAGDDPLLADLGVLEELQSLMRKSASKRLEAAATRKQRGNDAFQAGDADKALRAYLEALWLLRALPSFDSMPPCDKRVPCGRDAAPFLGARADGLDEKNTLLRSLHGNVCAVSLKRKDWVLAQAAAEHILTSKTCPTKECKLAVRRRAKALTELGVAEVAWTREAPPVPAKVVVTKPSKLAGGFFSAKSTKSKLGETRVAPPRVPKKRPTSVAEDELMEGDEALKDYAQRVASGHAYAPGKHPEDGKDVEF